MKTTQVSMADYNAIAAKIQEVETAIAELGDTINQVPLNNQDLYGSASKGIPDPKWASQQDMENLRGNVFQNLDYLHKALADLHDKHDKTKWEMHDKIWKTMADHTKGHLPAINSAEQMERAIGCLGLDKEYSVSKKVVYASDGKPSKWVFEWDLDHPKG